MVREGTGVGRPPASRVCGVAKGRSPGLARRNRPVLPGGPSAVESARFDTGAGQRHDVCRCPPTRRQPRGIASQRSLSTRITNTLIDHGYVEVVTKVLDEADADPYGWAADIMLVALSMAFDMRA